jgi:hypothetical protein
MADSFQWPAHELDVRQTIVKFPGKATSFGVSLLQSAQTTSGAQQASYSVNTKSSLKGAGWRGGTGTGPWTWPFYILKRSRKGESVPSLAHTSSWYAHKNVPLSAKQYCVTSKKKLILCQEDGIWWQNKLLLRTEGKVKGRFTLWQAMKAHRGSREIALLFL